MFTPSLSTDISPVTFGVLDVLLKQVGNRSQTAEAPETWTKIHQLMSLNAFMIAEAARSLNDVV